MVASRGTRLPMGMCSKVALSAWVVLTDSVLGLVIRKGGLRIEMQDAVSVLELQEALSVLTQALRLNQSADPDPKETKKDFMEAKVAEKFMDEWKSKSWETARKSC